MYSTPVCSGLPPPGIGGNGMNGQCFGTNLGSYPQPFVNNPYFVNCGPNAFQNPPPSSFSGMNVPPVNMAAPTMQFSQPPPGYPSGPMGVSHSYPQFSSHPSFPHSPSFPPAFQNYLFTPPGNQFTRPAYPFTSQTPPANPVFSNQLLPVGSQPFRKNDRKFKEKKPAPFHCKSCDRDYDSKDRYDEHVAEHITCYKPGCDFTAHPKMVEMHISLQHRTGLANRIVKGNSPEEIEKWIAERKKHFPTKTKIEEKQAQQVEMDKRGERYNERQKTFDNRDRNIKAPFNRSQRHSDNRGSSFKQRMFSRKFGSSNRHTPTNGSERPDRRRECPIESDDEDCVRRKLPAFLGMDGDKYRLSVSASCHSISPQTDLYLRLSESCDQTVSERNATAAESGTSSTTKIFTSDSDDDHVRLVLGENIQETTVLTSSVTCEPDTKPTEARKSFFFNANDLDSEDSDVVDLDEMSNPTPTLATSVTKSDCAVDVCNTSTDSGHFSSATMSSLDHSSSASSNITPHRATEPANIAHKLLLKVTASSLDLIRGYDSADDSGDEECVANSSTSGQPTEGGQDDDAPEEYSSKMVAMEMLSANRLPEQPVADSIDDDAPEECSSRVVPSEVSAASSPSADATDKAESGDNVAAESKRQARKRKRRNDKGVDGDADEGDTTVGGDKAAEEIAKQPRIFQQYRKYRRPTLLEKLLASEIRHERNVILQCVRYVVQNAYFKIDQPK